MSYARVIPRDLFNEASLLKCLGQLALWLLDHDGQHGASFPEDYSGIFEVSQNPHDGSIQVRDLDLYCDCGDEGEFEVVLRRPLNSREPWPLYASCPSRLEALGIDEEEIAVFDDTGSLTNDFRRMIGASPIRSAARISE